MMDRTLALDLLEKSLLLANGLNTMETDPAYMFSDDDLWDIITMVMPTHNSTYTALTIPDAEVYFVLLLAKREVYYRLATASAPFYPLTAEGASLRKDYRFDHYMALIKQVETTYATAWENYLRSGSGIDVREALLRKNHFTAKNYTLGAPPTVQIVESEPATDSIGIAWTKATTGFFKEYVVRLDTAPVYDRFDREFRETVLHTRTLEDIHLNSCRVTGLTPNTTYFVAVETRDENGLSGVATSTIKTLTATP